MGKNMHLLAVQTTVCNTMHKNLPGIELMMARRQNIKSVDLDGSGNYSHCSFAKDSSKTREAQMSEAEI